MFRELEKAKSALDYLHTVLYYIGNASKHLAAEEVVMIVQQTLADEGNEIMQTVADYWIEQGIERGIERGIEQGIEQSILELLEVRFGAIDLEIKTRITAVTNLTTLRQLLRHAALAETTDEFLAQLDAIEA
jgi:hypothetical protein